MATVARSRALELPFGSSQYHRRIFGLYAANNDMNNEKPDRFYELISVEDADKMLQQERLVQKEEIRKLKNLLELQHKQLCEFNVLDSRTQLPCADVDMGFVGHDASIGGNDIQNDAVDYLSGDDTGFFPPSSTDEEYKQQHQQSHSAAERRTIEIELRQVDDENEELENEFNDQQQSHETDIEEFQGLIYDVRHRSDCIQQELKLEFKYFERAKVELEEVLNQELSKTRELEQQLLLARREQEILDEAVIEAQRRQQELQGQEEQERQQERHREQLQQDREEQLRRDHQELVELERNEAEFDKAYFNFFNDDRTDGDINDHHISNQPQEDVAGVDGDGQGPQQYQYSANTAQSQSPQSTLSPQYDAVYRQTVAKSVTSQTTDPPQAKRTTRKNSDAHGIFMNFNDILM